MTEKMTAGERAQAKFKQKVKELHEADLSPLARMEAQFIAIVECYNESTGIIREAEQAAVAREREACAALADAREAGFRRTIQEKERRSGYKMVAYEPGMQVAAEIAAAIRVRTEEDHEG